MGREDREADCQRALATSGDVDHVSHARNLNVPMPAVISVPRTLDELSFEEVFGQLAACSSEDPVTVDARHCFFATPFGLTALLAVAQTRTARLTLLIPEDPGTVAYWSRAGFFRHAQSQYAMRDAVPFDASSTESAQSLELTRLSAGNDTRPAISRVHRRVLRLFTNVLQLDPGVAIDLADAMSAWCGNIAERPGHVGWVTAQSYRFRSDYGTRPVVAIAVCDAGASVEERDDRQVGIDALCRHRGAVEARLLVRSGTTRRTFAPSWDHDDDPVVEGLALFPGVSMQLTVPGRATP